MSKNKLIFAAIVAVLLLIVGTFVILEWFGPPRTFELSLTGKKGLEVIGTVEEQGVKRKVEATLPAKMTLKGQHIAFEFVPKAGKMDEPLKLEVKVDGAFFGSVTSAPGVRGHVHWPRIFGSMRKSYLLGSVTNDEADRIRQ